VKIAPRFDYLTKKIKASKFYPVLILQYGVFMSNWGKREPHYAIAKWGRLILCVAQVAAEKQNLYFVVVFTPTCTL
jgi:hypothetical protein